MYRKTLDSSFGKGRAKFATDLTTTETTKSREETQLSPMNRRASSKERDAYTKGCILDGARFQKSSQSVPTSKLSLGGPELQGARL